MNEPTFNTCQLCDKVIFRGEYCRACHDLYIAMREARQRSPFWRLAKAEFPGEVNIGKIAAQIELAYTEGRLNKEWADLLHVDTGEYTCHVCGMRHRTSGKARNCCADMVPVSEDQRAISEGRSMRLDMGVTS